MYGTIESLDRLIEKFASLPGVGKKTAERLAYGLIMYIQVKSLVVVITAIILHLV